MFVIQVVIAFQKVVETTDQYERIRHYGDTRPSWIPVWLRWWSPSWLAGDPRCEPVTTDYTPKDATPCGVFYGIATGYINLMGVVTLAILIQHVFALSGALLLLIVR